MKGKVAIITGASSGIGLAAAKEFAAQGSFLALAARNKEKLDSLVAQLDAEYGKTDDGKEKFIAVATDVTKEEDCRNLVEKCASHFGK